jgi:sterol desaturase/sphingolipid hydroxylase (fatty acid hydroxylase superfamily)
MDYRGTVLKSRDGIPRPSLPPPGIDMAREARTARSRFYPVTVAYTAYALVVLTLGFRADALRAAAFLAAAVVTWTLIEYLVHRYLLHGRFPDGDGWLTHRLHRFLDTAHGDHHLRPWDGLHINGGLDTVPAALVLAPLSFLAPLPTAPVFVATVLASYVVEEWVHYTVHFHLFTSRYFVYIRKHHLYHHSARGAETAYGLSSGLWDVPFGTRIPQKDRRILYRDLPRLLG